MLKLLDIKEGKNKIIMDTHLHTSNDILIKLRTKVKIKRKCHTSLMEIQNVIAILENSLAFSYKAKHPFTT